MVSLIALTCTVLIIIACVVYIPRLVTSKRINKVRKFFMDEPANVDEMVDTAKSLGSTAKSEVEREEKEVEARRKKVDDLRK